MSKYKRKSEFIQAVQRDGTKDLKTDEDKNKLLIEACDVYNEGIGIIAMFGNVIGIQGIASTPLSIVETITSIVKSHKVLKSDETVWKGTGFTSCKLII